MMTQLQQQKQQQQEQRVLFLDGGLGTSLEDKYGLKFGQNTPLWSSHPLVSGQTDTLLACQRDFGLVPVDILLTATYQVSIEGFAATALPGTDYETGIPRTAIVPFLEDALGIAEIAVSSHAAIALSLGPYGACMVPSQEYSANYDPLHSSVEQLRTWHVDRLSLFSQIRELERRVQFLAFETVPRLEEIVAIRRLFAPNSSHGSILSGAVPYWISCVFPGDAFTLPDGTPIDQVVDALFNTDHSPIQPWGVGVNCTKLDKIPEIVKQYEAALSRLSSLGKLGNWPVLLLYPDGTNGEVYNTTTKEWQMPAGSESAPVVSLLCER